MVTINSAAPRLISNGINDRSRRVVQAEREAIPTFLVKIWGYAKTGPTDPQLVSSNARTLLYGQESFNERGKYATHTTVLSNVINAQGAAQMFHRVVPKDAGPKATLRLSLDFLETQVPVYELNDDGSIKKDDDGRPVETGEKITGAEAAWVITQVPMDTLGLGTITDGALSNGSVQSKLYPIQDFEHPYVGEDGNNFGLRQWAPVAVGLSPFDDRLLTETKVYPIRMACLQRADVLSTGKLVRTKTNDTSVLVSLKPGAVDRNVADALLYVGDVFTQAYSVTDDVNVPPILGPFGTVHTYDANVETLLRKVYENEKAFVDEFSDITGTDVDDELYMINLHGAFSSKNVPYKTLHLKTEGTNVARMSENSVTYAKGGSDGTMNETLLAELVSEEVAEYANPNSELMQRAVHVESFVIDSGFPLATKYELVKAISIRKDIGVILSTHDTQGETLTASEESSIGAALRTRLQLYPESEVHGTAVVRGMVVSHSGVFLDSTYKNRLPLTLEIAKKAADYMGAASGRWKDGRSFSSAPLSEITSFKDVNATFKPDSVRNADWKNSIVTAQAFKRRSIFFPALKTAYDDDTSVLNSFITMCGCIELEKVGFRSWQQFVGTDRRTNPVLKKDVEKFIADDVKDRFDTNFTIIPEVYFTQADLDRGYSWSTRIKLYAANMKTVNTFELEAYRADDLVAAV